jgi:carboxypeptidase Taq
MKESQAQKDYGKLHEKSQYSSILGGIQHLLDWDQETYMPPAASGIRSEQLKILAGLIHKSRTSPAFAKALSKLIDLKSGKILVKDLTSPQKVAVQVWRRDYLKDTCLPASFVEEMAQLSSQAVVAWRAAKAQESFHTFAPYLDKIIYMNRKKADYLGYDNHPYDALMDLFEPGAKTAEISPLFTSLRKSITTLLTKIKAAKQIDDRFLFGKFEKNKQMEFGHMLMEAVGYDQTKGRLDISTHPFSCSIHPTDSRITSRIHPQSLMGHLSAVMHECGHSLYEMGLPEEHYGSPLGQAISLGMHESQSRWWETRIGQSKSFWEHFLPLLKKTFPKQLDNVKLEAFYKAVNKVEPSFIRVEADEVTYSLHVILRFELEKALIEGSLSVREIPEAWNAQMQELLGITPSNYAEGCLQDIHWSMGALGYFPTYTLGNLYAAHLFAAFEKEHPDWEKRVAKGELLFIKEWLNHHVHHYGRQYNSKELLKHVTGKEFSTDAYSAYLNKKYKEIYKSQ